MKTARLEAFSDGVLAIILTIMVLELKVPRGGEWSTLSPLIPTFLAYVMSFVYVGIYWNNHHHLLQLADRIHGAVLWANLHLLFWLSLIPFVTGWMGANHFEPLPTAMYGVVLLASAIAWLILQRTLIRGPDANLRLREAIGGDLKGKASAGLYALGIGLAFVEPRLSVVLYVVVALLWLIPDRRFEAQIRGDSR